MQAENPFAGLAINLPTSYQEYFQRYSQTHREGGRIDALSTPFPRMVDMWFASIGYSVRKGLKRLPEGEAEGRSEKKYKAMEGVVLGSDPWRVRLLMLLAIAETGDISVVSQPTAMLKIANEYALAGLSEVITCLEGRGSDTALDAVTDLFVDLMEGNQ